MKWLIVYAFVTAIEYPKVTLGHVYPDQGPRKVLFDRKECEAITRERNSQTQTGGWHCVPVKTPLMARD
jgi:hypothetical protein